MLININKFASILIFSQQFHGIALFKSLKNCKRHNKGNFIYVEVLFKQDKVVWGGKKHYTILNKIQTSTKWFLFFRSIYNFKVN